MILLVLGAPALAGSCEILAEGAPTSELDCRRAALWAVRCNVPAKGKRRLRLEVPEYGLEAEARLPLATEERFEVTLLGPNGARGQFAVDAKRPWLSDQVVGALQLCRPGPPGTLRVTVTEHARTGFAEEVDSNGVVNRVPTYGAGTVVATARARIQPPSAAASERPEAEPEAVKGKLSVRRDAGWVDLAWEGQKLEVPAEGGAIRLLRLDFPRQQVAEALGPGDPTTLLAEDLERWLAGDPASRLGLVAFRGSGVPVPLGEVPMLSELSPGQWRGSTSPSAEFRVGPVGAAVRVAIAYRPSPLDESARNELEPLWKRALD